MIDKDQASLVKTNINLIRCEKDELSELCIKYDSAIAKRILSKEPKNDLEYELAKLEAELENKDLQLKILEKQNEIESLESLLEHKEEVAVEYKKFEEKFNKEFGEQLELIMDLIGDD